MRTLDLITQTRQQRRDKLNEEGNGEKKQTTKLEQTLMNKVDDPVKATKI